MTQEKKRYKKMIDASERMITLIVIARHPSFFSFFFLSFFCCFSLNLYQMRRMPVRSAGLYENTSISAL
jgi:hypothetical protein